MQSSSEGTTTSADHSAKPTKLNSASTDLKASSSVDSPFASSSAPGSTSKSKRQTRRKRLTAPFPWATLDICPPLPDKGPYSSIIKPGARFTGFQESGMQHYKVEVELAEVNLSESTMSGFLTIYGLTSAHPVITTFFEGEIVGKNFTFETIHEDWGSTLKNDIQHWARFQPWRSLNLDLLNEANHDVQDYYHKNALKNEYIFMRWKELFLCPDSTVTDIKGASFAGFYYICFNQVSGHVSGLYFHKLTDKFQQLTLSFVPDHGVTPIYKYS